jgi:hypothetical protein
MHRHNNQDHPKLAANSAVSSMLNSGTGKSVIWRINAELSTPKILNPPKFGTQVTLPRLCFAHRGLESIAIMSDQCDFMACKPASHALWN